jgi:hypothetical protein
MFFMLYWLFLDVVLDYFNIIRVKKEWRGLRMWQVYNFDVKDGGVARFEFIC